MSNTAANVQDNYAHLHYDLALLHQHTKQLSVDGKARLIGDKEIVQRFSLQGEGMVIAALLEW